MKRLLLLSLCFLLFGGTVISNNVRFESSARIISVDADRIATIELSLRWDNAWRDYNNWDGVWLFLKYREGKGGTWKHVNLETSGHTIVDSANVNKFTYHVGKNGEDNSKGTGLFVVLSENAYANPNLKCQLKWKLPAGAIKDDFDKIISILYAHALEMVYVRTGAYTLGQQNYKGAFAATPINKEDALDVNINTDGGNFEVQSLTASYPKGFQGFYAMKYELGQEQCVHFLNSLLKVQQEELVPTIKEREGGHNIFGGEKTGSTKRNGVVLVTKSTDEKPHTLACDLNRDNPENSPDDGQNIPCGFMNVNFLNAYCSWSGLRPMSELEFEKSCRRPYPLAAVDNEYVWGSVSEVMPITGVVTATANTSKETPLDGNANSTGAYKNPIRSGSFAAVSYAGTSALERQYQTGSTYWGLMEMGGNLKEIVASVAHNNLKREKHGLGAYNKSFWSQNSSHYGYRGGGFESAIELLRTSDRTEINSILKVDVDDQSSAGFRGVRSFSSEEMGISVAAGAIAPQNVCSASAIYIIETSAASLIGADGEKAIFTYEWYVDGDKMTADFNGSESVIRDLIPGKEYTIERRAICQYGAASDTCKFTIPKISLNIETCHVGSADDALNTLVISLGKGAINEVVFEWFYKDYWLGSGASFTPTVDMFGKDKGQLDLFYRATLADCPTVFEGTVKAHVN